MQNETKVMGQSMDEMGLSADKMQDAGLTLAGVSKAVEASIEKNAVSNDSTLTMVDPIAKKIKALYKEDNKDELNKYTKILYSEACMIAGLPIDNPTEISNLICEAISK